MNEPAGDAAGDEVGADADANAGGAIDAESEGAVPFGGELSDGGREYDRPQRGNETAQKCESEQNALRKKEGARGSYEGNSGEADKERFAEAQTVNEESRRKGTGDAADAHGAGHGTQELFIEAAVEEEEIVEKEEDEQTQIKEERGGEEGPEGAREAGRGELVASAAIKKRRQTGKAKSGTRSEPTGELQGLLGESCSTGQEALAGSGFCGGLFESMRREGGKTAGAREPAMGQQA